MRKQKEKRTGTGTIPFVNWYWVFPPQYRRCRLVLVGCDTNRRHDLRGGRRYRWKRKRSWDAYVTRWGGTEMHWIGILFLANAHIYIYIHTHTERKYIVLEYIHREVGGTREGLVWEKRKEKKKNKHSTFLGGMHSSKFPRLWLLTVLHFLIFLITWGSLGDFIKYKRKNSRLDQGRGNNFCSFSFSIFIMGSFLKKHKFLHIAFYKVWITKPYYKLKMISFVLRRVTRDHCFFFPSFLF